MRPQIVEGLYVRAWCAEDHPAATYDAASTLVRSVPAADVGREAVARRGVVEIAWMMGGLLPRALLGAVVVPATDRMVTVTAPVSAAYDGPPVIGAFRAELRVGLPEEYAEAAVDGLLASSAAPRSIVVDRAAHHPVESSRMVFASVARVLAYVLEHGELPDAERLRELIVADAAAQARGRSRPG